MCFLTDDKINIDLVKDSLSSHDFSIVKELRDKTDWEFSGPSLVVSYAPKKNGFVSIDIVEQPWPDSMGDIKVDTKIFSAWSMGYFGPFTFPGCLLRARQHSWAWTPGKLIAQNHKGFIRIRISYVFGAKDNSPILPDDYDCSAELIFLSKMAMVIMDIPGVYCYFNPNGEVLRDSNSFQDSWRFFANHQSLPLPLWSNVRFFKLNDNIAVMDTVGNGQLDVSDIEAVFPLSKYDPGEVDSYLRNVTSYLINFSGELKSNEPIDGPGDSDLTWILELHEKGLVDPPRMVVRLYPKEHQKEIHFLTSSLA